MIGDFQVPENGDVELDSDNRERPSAEIFPTLNSSSVAEKCCFAEVSKGKGEPYAFVYDMERSKSN